MFETRLLCQKEQMLSVKQTIQAYQGRCKIHIESCYSPMLALINDTKLFGNLNVGRKKGCIAGYSTFSVNVDGLLSPCRHLEYFESAESLQSYMEHSAIQQKIRSLPEAQHEPCTSCHFGHYCRHCLAINDKLHHTLFFGDVNCPLQKQGRNDVSP